MVLAVGIDARILTIQQEKVGIAQYISALLGQSRNDDTSQVRLHPLSFAPLQSDPNSHLKIIAKIPGIPWQSISLPWALRTSPIKVFHGPAFAMPRWGRIPAVVTIHDLAFVRLPETVSEDTRRYLSQVVPVSLARAQHIIVPSSQVAQDITQHFPYIDHSKISVIPLGGDRLPRIVGARPISEPYVLHVGTIEPRKNVDVLIDGFLWAKRQYQIPHRLILIGSAGWKSEAVHRRIKKHNPLIAHVGYVDDDVLSQFYAHADLVVSVSHYEGYGLAVAEAAAWGRPVISTDTGCARDMPEGIVDILLGAGETLGEKIGRHLCHPTECTPFVRTWRDAWDAHKAIYQKVALG